MRRVMFVMLLAVQAFAGSAEAQGFSNASLNGTYLMMYRGHSLDFITTQVSIFPVETARAARAVVQFDGAGNWTIITGGCGGERIQNIPGTPNYGPVPLPGGPLDGLSGTYSINPDGSGVINLSTAGPDCGTGPSTFFNVQVSPDGNATFDNPIDNDGRATFGISGVILK